MRFILISLLKFYKAVISPWLPPSCRFVPTCSEYAREAIERHGALRGSAMAIWRLLRCQPFCTGGYNPVKYVECSDLSPLSKGATSRAVPKR